MDLTLTALFLSEKRQMVVRARINWMMYSSISVRDFTQLTLYSGASLLVYVLAALFWPSAPLECVSAFPLEEDQIQEKNLYDGI